MNTEKRVNKGINTYLTVKLMPGKTMRNMWTDFFKGNVPASFFGKVVSHDYFKGNELPDELRELIVRVHGEDSSVFKLFEVREHNSFDTKLMREEIYKVVPFVIRVEGKKSPFWSINSHINRWSLETRLDKEGEIQIQVDTYSYDAMVKEEDIKALNKDNARKLRKYLVGLLSVQGVPYSCTYKDDVEIEKSCEV